MNPYDGLNLPDLLALMNGLEAPAPVPWIPATSGWWVLLAWLVAVLLLVIWRLVQRRRRNRYRRQALSELAAIQRQPDAMPPCSTQRIAAVLRRTALAAYPRREIAPLYGSSWARFLRDSANNDQQIANAAEQLAAAPYQPDANGEALLEPARRWVRLHRA